MNFDMNYPPPEEDNDKCLDLFSYLQPQPPQPNLQLELEPQPHEFNPFPSQYLPLEAPESSFSLIPKYQFLPLEAPESSFSLIPKDHVLTLLPRGLQTKPCTPSLQETYSSELPNPSMPMLQQFDDMHEQELLPPCDLPSQEEPNVQHQEIGPYRLRPRRLPVRARKQGKTDTITPPYPWATSTRATVYSLDHLLSQNIESIPGIVKCKRCGEQYEILFDLREKFNEVAGFMIKEKDNMHDRAPKSWNKPVLPTCNRCGKENSLDPVLINIKKKSINWLFLLLGQMIGCCNLGHLKYFCKHNMTHRTAAKDRLIYLTYLGLCKQLSPDGIFDA